MIEEQLQEQLQIIDLFPVSSFDVLFNLLIALICGGMISIVYRLVYKGTSYSVTYVNSLVLLTMITSLVILVIGNNLARAFGLVGAMSIIRFRTAVRDVMDIVFIFFALSVGMAAGVGLHIIAILGTIGISITIIVLSFLNFGEIRKRKHLLQITVHGSLDVDSLFIPIIKKYCRRYNTVNIKQHGQGITEIFYHIALKKREIGNQMFSEISKIEGVSSVNLYFDDDDTNPPV